MKHTPGPWKLTGKDEGGTYYVQKTFVGDGISSPFGTFTIAALNDAFEQDVGQGKANAHLIAAAPDLLEAAWQARDWLGEYLYENEDDVAALERYNDLDDAIHKARRKEVE